MSQSWELGIKIEVDGSTVSFSCTNTQINRIGVEPITEYSIGSMDLSFLSEKIKEVLAFSAQEE